MLYRLTALSSIAVIVLAGCATSQENPYYKYSSKYKGDATTTVTQAGSIIQTAPVSYETVDYAASQRATYTQVNHECLKKEKNHELIGAGLGGSVGAIAGKKLIGGTKGTVIGAGLGGAAGYGIGDKLVNCDPQPVSVQQIPTQSQQAYTQQTYSQQAHRPAPTVAASYAAPVIAEPYISPTDAEFNNISETGTPGYQVLQAQNGAASYSQATYGAQEVSYDYGANTVAASAATIAIPGETRLIHGGSYGSHIVKQGDTVYSLSRKLCVGIADVQSLNNLDASYGINIGDTLQLPASNC